MQHLTLNDHLLSITNQHLTSFRFLTFRFESYFCISLYLSFASTSFKLISYSCFQSHLNFNFLHRFLDLRQFLQNQTLSHAQQNITLELRPNFLLFLPLTCQFLIFEKCMGFRSQDHLAVYHFFLQFEFCVFFMDFLFIHLQLDLYNNSNLLMASIIVLLYDFTLVHLICLE